MVKTGMSPVGGGVAIVALFVALHMVGRLAVYPHIVMAILTLIRRADEYAVEMAAVACHILMPASQRKAGGEMVEFAGSGSGVRTE